VKRRHAISTVLLVAACIGCGATTRVVELPDTPPSPQQMAELWVDPGPRPRELFYGIGGRELAPSKAAEYRFKGKDELGFSVSYDVLDPDGIEWSAKIGPEAQTEVVVSRLLWGLGYHQPPLHYLPSWNLVQEGGEIRKESEARFRPKLERLDRLEDYWSWKENPFIGTRPFNGLLVILLMLNSTDLKDDNNSIYEVKGRIRAATPDVRRWFVVRDLGAALGETGKLFPRRNWIEGFEEEEFIEGVKDGRIEFAFTGRHRELLRMITPADLRWAATRLQGLTEQQWHDAFRAANYTDALRDRYIRKIRQKIEQALAVAGAAQTTPDV
jgi:hypothetical protein